VRDLTFCSKHTWPPRCICFAVRR